MSNLGERSNQLIEHIRSIHVPRNDFGILSLLALTGVILAFAYLFITRFSDIMLGSIAVPLLFAQVPIYIILLWLFKSGRLLFEGKRFLVFALVFFLFSRIIWLVLVPTEPISDFMTYHKLALQMAAGENTGYLGGLTNGWGYPFVLSFLYRVFGGSLWTAKIFNLLLGTCSLWLTYYLGWWLGGKSIAQTSVLMFLFWPVQLMYTSVIASEHFGLVIGLVILLLLKKVLEQTGWKVYGLLTLIAAISVLGYSTRPTLTVYLITVCIVFILWNFPSWNSLIRVGFIFGSFAAFFMLYFWVLKTYNGGYLPRSSRAVAMNLLAGTDFKTRGVYIDEIHGAFMRSMPDDQAVQAARELIIRQVTEQPLIEIIKLATDKAGILWGGAYYGSLYSTYDVDDGSRFFTFLANYPSTPRKLEVLSYGYQSFIVLLGCFGCFRLMRDRHHFQHKALVAVILVFLGATAIHMGFVADGRYQYTFQPALFWLASASILPIKHAGEPSDY